MKTLLVMRHAKSSWKTEGMADQDRPLNERGKRDAPRMGQWLKEQGIHPECILSSSAKRARKTAKAVAEVLGCEDAIDVRDELYGAGPDEYILLLRALPDSVGTVLIVAHDPTVSHFVSAHAGTLTEMPTGAIAQFNVPVEFWKNFGPSTKCELRDYWTPKSLPEEA